MKLARNFSLSTFLSQLGSAGPATRKEERTAEGLLDEMIGEEISLERIKDIIIDANAALDETKRMDLLERADRLEARLVENYRAKGLQITADNICATLDDHRRRYHNH